jgi:hypothetical protein
MKTCKLSDFGLNKQSLKRKLDKVEDSEDKTKLEILLSRRTTIYTIAEVEFIVKSFYSKESTYYVNHNKNKYDVLKSLIDVKKSVSIEASVEKDVRNVVERSQQEVMNYAVYKNELVAISQKYNISFVEISNKANELEIEWINKLN